MSTNAKLARARHDLEEAALRWAMRGGPTDDLARAARNFLAAYDGEDSSVSEMDADRDTISDSFVDPLAA